MIKCHSDPAKIPQLKNDVEMLGYSSGYSIANHFLAMAARDSTGNSIKQLFRQ